MKSLLIVLLGLTAVLAYPASDAADWAMIPNVDGSLRLVNVKELEFQASISSRSAIVVDFILFTKSTPAEGQIVSSNDLDTLRKFFNPQNPTRFISHGWQGSRQSPENALIRQKYLARGDYNMITIDWSSGAATMNYIAASKNTLEAGKQVAAFVDYLSLNLGLNFDTTYLIGHSLGAHVVGTAGKHITRGRINTIFGLDAALPLFSIDKPTKRLDQGDALYVESIHTDGGVHGFDVPIGDASFYPNWGVNQPGCDDHTGSCSHARSFQYFAESLDNPDDFVAEQCTNYADIASKTCQPTGKEARMGGEPSNYGRGVAGEYYTPTNSQNPFAVGTKWMSS